MTRGRLPEKADAQRAGRPKKKEKKHIKQQKLDYHIFTCKFPISSLQCHDLLTL